MGARLEYTADEIMAECDYARRLRHDGTLFHGGFDAAGRYVPPRSRHRIAAIRAWTERLAAEDHPTRVCRLEDLDLRFFPTVAQTKLLLRNGCRGAMTRILTLVGITEGFGNDGLRLFPRLPLQDHFVEPIDGTCLAHLDRGLFDAHGNDEAGCGDEAGHDRLWFAIRDVALGHPVVTPDMWENLPIAPPPGYTGPAKPSPDAISPRELSFLFPDLPPMLELLFALMAQLLVIELFAYGTFAWAREVLADPECSAAPELAPRLVACIQADEDIHVGYLQCALAEARARTLRGGDGSTLAGATVIDAIVHKIVAANTDGGRRDRLLRYRMAQIRAELAARPDGEPLLAEFAHLGPVPPA